MRYEVTSFHRCGSSSIKRPIPYRSLLLRSQTSHRCIMTTTIERRRDCNVDSTCVRPRCSITLHHTVLADSQICSLQLSQEQTPMTSNAFRYSSIYGCTATSKHSCLALHALNSKRTIVKLGSRERLTCAIHRKRSVKSLANKSRYAETLLPHYFCPCNS